SMRGILRFAQNDNIRQFFMSPLVSSRVSPTWEAFHEVHRRLFSISNDGRHTGGWSAAARADSARRPPSNASPPAGARCAFGVSAEPGTPSCRSGADEAGG